MLRRKYFVRHKEYKARYPEDLKKIRAHLESIGSLDTTDAELESLYSKFSSERYCAGWSVLRFEFLNDILEEFADWLEQQEKPYASYI